MQEITLRGHRTLAQRYLRGQISCALYYAALGLTPPPEALPAPAPAPEPEHVPAPADNWYCDSCQDEGPAWPWPSRCPNCGGPVRRVQIRRVAA